MTSLSFGKLPRNDLQRVSPQAELSIWELGSLLLERLSGARDLGSWNEEVRHLALFTALRDALEERVEVPDNRLSVSVVAQRFDFVRDCWRQHGLPLSGAVHLEVGCGVVNPFGRMFSHLMLGASRAYCLELDVPTAWDGPVRALARLAAAALVDPGRLFGDYPVTGREILTHIEGFDLARLQRGDPGGLDARRLVFLDRPVTATGLSPASVDVVFSNSVLEHLPDVGEAFAELSRVTRPGGFGFHGIDLRDHRWYEAPSTHPLEFLTIPPRDPIVLECNRLRHFEYEELFARHGFSVVDRGLGPKIPIPAELRARLAPPWRSMTDEQLEGTWTTFVVRKD